MKEVRLQFPKGFFWGASLASYQCEGGIDNNDWAEAARQGKVPSADPDGPDHYKLFERDFDLAESLGHNCLRISIEWSRIEPEEGEFNQVEIEHYKQVIKALKERGLEPFITIWHFSLPLWFSKKGGFANPNAPDLFARYCAKLASELGEDCVHWATINEPLVYTSNGYWQGIWPPFKRKSIFTLWKVVKGLIESHKCAYTAMKKVSPTHEVGIVKHNIYFHNKKGTNSLIVRFISWIWNKYFLSQVVNYCDSIGLNYYLHHTFGFQKEWSRSDMGWDIYPEGVYHTLMELKQYKKPLYVAECGIADEDDDLRADYIRALVKWMHRAIEDGVPLRGFMYWSLLDNFEWSLGYQKKFGLVEYDKDTKVRKVRPSAFEYKKICQNNGVI